MMRHCRGHRRKREAAGGASCESTCWSCKRGNCSKLSLSIIWTVRDAVRMDAVAPEGERDMVRVEDGESTDNACSRLRI
jgi:hypothetical protein